MEREKQFEIQFFIFCFVILCSISKSYSKIENAHPSPNLHLSPAALKSYLTRLLSHNATLWNCPAPKYPLEDNDCTLPVCGNENECAAKNQSCCFNGCIFTCTDRMAPPPVIDWEDEPKPPPVREEGAAVLRCTTTPRPAPSEPVGCPEGYVCRIDDYGDPLEGRSNSGVCVPDDTSNEDTAYLSREEESELKEKTRKQTVYLPGGCILSETQYKNMQDFKARAYIVDCFCVNGSIECQISSEIK